MTFRTLFIFVLLLFCLNMMSQGYKTLKIKRGSIKNNSLFKEGKVFSYNHSIEHNGEDRKVCLLWQTKSDHSEKTLSGWKLVNSDDSECTALVNDIRYIVYEDNDHIKKTNRRQTEVKIEYLKDLPVGEFTGIVENDLNIWMHPPRSYFFKVLNICPYPFVKFPVKVNDSWTDKIKVSSYWADSLWGYWDKNLHLELDYRVSGKEEIYFSGGNIECFVINSSSYSDLGVSLLRIYYNEIFGFVKLNYTVLDKFKIEFVLTDIQNEK